MPGWAPGALELRLGAGRERPGCLWVQRGLCCRGRRGRRLGGLLGRCSFLGGRRLCRCGLLRCYCLFGGSGFLCRCCCLLGRCGLLCCYYLFGGSGFLCRCCCLLGRCGLLRCYCLLGGSGFLCRCCCLLGRCSLLRCYWLCRRSFFRWGSLLSGWFFRSCHHVLLGSICKEHFLSAVDRKRSMEMEKNSISMNTGTPSIRRSAALSVTGVV